MADENREGQPNGAGGQPPASGVPAGGSPAADNAAAARARIAAKQAQEAEARAKALEEKLAAYEREKLSEAERLRKDLEDAKRKADRAEQIEKALAETLELELAELGEEWREKVAAYTDGLPPEERLRRVKKMKADGLFRPAAPSGGGSPGTPAPRPLGDQGRPPADEGLDLAKMRNDREYRRKHKAEIARAFRDAFASDDG